MKTISIGILIIFFIFPLFSQEKLISGVVFSLKDKSRIEGVNILVKGTAIGTTTDLKGEFSVVLPDNKSTLVFSSIGFITKEFTVGEETLIKIVLAEEVKELSEVVVVGYGQEKRKTLTGAVSTISSTQIKDLPSASFDEMIKGRATGVHVSSTSGEPGTGVLVRVRGTTSILATSDPLYIIDNIPITSGELAKIRAGGPSNALADINPNDIKSIDILKDASATAIYGSRGANGVILVTTKRGSSFSKPTINLNISYGKSTASKNPDRVRVDGPTFEKLQNEAAENNWVDKYGSLNLPDPLGNNYKTPYIDPSIATNTNWFDEIFRVGSNRNIDLNLIGGTEKINYYLSGGETDQQSIIKPSTFNRKSARLNLDFYATNKLKIGTSTALSYVVRNRVNNGNDISGALPNALFYPTNIPMYNQDGTYNKPFWESPLAVVKETDYQMKTERLIGNIYGEFKIIKDLSFRTSWGIDRSFIDEHRYYNTRLAAGAAVNGSAASSLTRDNTWIIENVLSYSHALGLHTASFLVGNTNQESTRSANSVIAQQFPSDAFRQISSASVISNAGTSSTSYGLVSYFGRINYSFNGRYLATINVRTDGSSRLSSKHRWGTFPAISLGWIVSEERFLKDLNLISYFKLRGSYGIIGNQNGIDNYQSLALWGGQPGGIRGGGGTTPINSVGSAASYVGASGFVPNQLGNPRLKHETTTQYDLGLHLQVLKDRLSFNFDYYNKQTRDLLLAVPVPRSLGYNQLVQNYGQIENKGWELGISGTPYFGKDFQWNLSINLSSNKNKVKKLSTPINAFSREFIRIEEGYPMYSFWVHQQLGVSPETGDVIWETGDDDVFDPNVDRFIVGNAQPDLFGGISNYVNFKNVDISFLFQFSYGNDILNYNRYFFEHGGERTTGYISTQLDRWQKPGDVTEIPRMSKINYSTELRPSRFIEDGSYLRLKNIELGYTLPISFTEKAGIKKFRLYLASQNLLTFTKYSGLDPEVSVDPSETVGGIDFATVPQARTLLTGINITF